MWKIHLARLNDTIGAFPWTPPARRAPDPAVFCRLPTRGQAKTKFKRGVPAQRHPSKKKKKKKLKPDRCHLLLSGEILQPRGEGEVCRQKAGAYLQLVPRRCGCAVGNDQLQPELAGRAAVNPWAGSCVPGTRAVCLWVGPKCHLEPPGLA